MAAGWLPQPVWEAEWRWAPLLRPPSGPLLLHIILHALPSPSPFHHNDGRRPHPPPLPRWAASAREARGEAVDPVLLWPDLASHGRLWPAWSVPGGGEAASSRGHALPSTRSGGRQRAPAAGSYGRRRWGRFEC